MDKVASDVRSRNMAAIRSKNTKPELAVRRALYHSGYRYRIHYKLKGKPDIVFVKKRVAIFVNGCFWHGHNCSLNHVPKSNTVFWKNKIEKNINRDTETVSKLKNENWKTVTIWECEIKNDLCKTIEAISDALQAS
jgi:DNA mismatch endonuclease (patch repair protein)